MTKVTGESKTKLAITLLQGDVPSALSGELALFNNNFVT